MLNNQQVHHFRDHGYVIVEKTINPKTISAIKGEITKWIHQSRSYAFNYGRLLNGQPRFDLEPGHTRTTPKLRRITNPLEISNVIKDVLLGGDIPQLLSGILGPNIKFDHCKINAKHPGMKAEVKYHQDHIFEPQTNDAMLTVLLMLDDNSAENGCLKVIPGSHKTKLNHFQNGYFTGTVDDCVAKALDKRAVHIEAEAGSLCIMDTWMVHGSSANTSPQTRELLIAEYKAADAFPLTTHKLPSRYMDSVVLGKAPGRPRYRAFQDFEIPEYYDGDSLFDLQDIVEQRKLIA